MNVRLIFGALIIGVAAAIAVPSGLSLAQSADQGAAAPKSAKPNVNVNPHKHRYWRHHGGRHPHFGSRRVRTHAPAARTSAN
ncbi:hypothetical protein [Bradyrhizobium sp. BWA-3-5]|uniref:hypothetical protein n=1 Tax=Bradyrhizobium sp. BWA-3-5 TaxID=3080013 RepID=UPI00293E48A0|nr:hypothetical protein [Bradyrhizobium sp. BWA-3-5]WOH64768.1 hypothetical protein RX331_30090 [Bradyrhizobium sp. BWA-3-5]